MPEENDDMLDTIIGHYMDERRTEFDVRAAAMGADQFLTSDILRDFAFDLWMSGYACGVKNTQWNSKAGKVERR